MHKEYTKPILSRVQLVIDEAVLSGCKTTAGAPGITAVNCDAAQGGASDCLNAGS